MCLLGVEEESKGGNVRPIVLGRDLARVRNRHEISGGRVSGGGSRKALALRTSLRGNPAS